MLRELVRSPLFIVGALILLWWIVCAIFGSSIAPHDPNAQNLLAINKAPSGSHIFGTDQLGRDIFSRVIAGSRDLLIVAPLATLLGTVLGTAVGLIMGYFRGPRGRCPRPVRRGVPGPAAWSSRRSSRATGWGARTSS